MVLEVGARLGPYEIQAPIGAGGMGEVYRARDARLDRVVAIKVLPESLATDPQFRERFDREARAISQLNHPHICTLHDVGQQDGMAYLVMEHLEGETLADRLERAEGRPFTPQEALATAIQIADALAGAHRSGIVHRDLKPGNIFLVRSVGASAPPIAKLLDFGLAKTAAPVVATSSLSMLPTTPPAAMTAQGAILGTFQYMAPEQIEGLEADARTDIFAFGGVLYEMLTGKKAFDGKTRASLIGAILKDEPARISAAQPLAPASLDRIVATCLAKDPDDRWQSARDLHRELMWVAEGNMTSGEAVSITPVGSFRWWQTLPWVVTIVAVAAVVGLLWTRTATGSRGQIRFVVTPPDALEMAGGPAAPQAAVSPDGTRVVFAATDASGVRRLFSRPLDSLDAQPLAGTEDGELPFWSPDGRAVAFFTRDRKLKRVSLAGGVDIICEVADDTFGGGTWNRDGVIVFSPGTDKPLYRVPSGGGAPAAITTLDRRTSERAHLWPSFLPDGRHFVYLVHAGDAKAGGIYLGSLDSNAKTKILDGEVRAMVASPNHLLFIRDGALMAQNMDGSGLLSGDPVLIARGVANNPTPGLGRATFTASTNGVIVYRTGGVGGIPVTQFTWLDRQGTKLSTVGQPGQFEGFDLSGDDGRLVAAVYDPRSRTSDIWVLDVARGASQRLTFDPAEEDEPSWSPDGLRVAFKSQRNGPFDLFTKPATGAADEVALKSSINKTPEHWSPDGRFLMFTADDPQAASDLWLLPMTGDRTPKPLVQTPAHEEQARFSPDGRWFAYTSDESGTLQVYVQPFPPTGAKWQVSTGGGSQPGWRRDGKELFYLSAERKLTAVAVNTTAAFQASPPNELFRISTRGFGRNEYSVSGDGQRFLIPWAIDQPTGAPITVLVDAFRRLQ